MSSFETEWERPEFDAIPSLAENAVWRLPGCNDTVLRKWLQEVYRDFCKRSGSLRTWRKVDLGIGETCCPIIPILSGEIDCVTDVKLCGMLASLHGWRVFGDPPMLELPHWCVRHEFVDPSRTVAFVQDRLNVGSLPVEVVTNDMHENAVLKFLVEAVEIPHISEERAPRAFLQRYGDTLIYGALSRMMSMVGKAWSDPAQAQQYAIVYENAISEARQRSVRGGPCANPCSGFAVDMSGAV